MAVLNRNNSYSFSEQVQVQSLNTTPVAVMSLPVGTVITSVLVRVRTAAVRAAGAANVTIGDDDSAAGFISSTDAKAAVGTIKGGDPTERGAYLYDSTKKGGFHKAYSADKFVYLVLDAICDTQGIYDVIINGYRANFS
jgi:hypothetical protein